MQKRTTLSVPHESATPPVEIRGLDLPRWQAWLAGVALVVMASVIYLPALRGGFVLDDDDYVTKNAALRTADGLRQIWFEIGTLPDYYALVYSTFWLEYHLWGLEPLGYHAVNVLLHAISAVLLWRLLVRLGVPGAWLAATIFAVHPVCVESVAWISERKNTLSLMLALATMFCYFRFEPADAPADAVSPVPRRWNIYVLSMCLFVLALFSKTAVAPLPAVLLVVYWWKRGRISLGTLARLAPMFLLAGIMSAVTIWSEVQHNGAHGDDWMFSPAERLLIAGRAWWFYVGKLAWPHPLTFVYPRWTIDVGQWWQFAYPMAALAAIVALWLLRHRIGRGPLAAAMIFAAMLLPVLGLVNFCYMRLSFVADHFQYHAACALFTLAAAGAYTIVARDRTATTKSIAAVVVSALIVVLSVLSWRQSTLYANAITLYQDTLVKNPACWMAEANLGQAFIDAGRAQEGVEHFRRALQIKPNCAEAHNSLGVQIGIDGRVTEAIDHFRQAVRLRATFAEAHSNLGSALLKTGRLHEAREELRCALRLNLNSASTHHNLATVTAQLGQLPEAIGHYEEALRLNAKLPETHNNLGNALIRVGRPQDAIGHYRRALQLKSDYLEAYLNLAIAQSRCGQSSQAIDTAEQALAMAQAARQTHQVQRIQAWLATYRARIAETPTGVRR